MLALTTEENLGFLTHILKQRTNSLYLFLFVSHLNSHLIAALFQGIELISSLTLFIVGASQQFPFDEIEMYFFIFVFALFLHSGVPFKAVESRAFDGLKGLSSFLDVFGRLIEGQSSEFDL